MTKIMFTVTATVADDLVSALIDGKEGWEDAFVKALIQDLANHDILIDEKSIEAECEFCRVEDGEPELPFDLED